MPLQHFYVICAYCCYLVGFYPRPLLSSYDVVFICLAQNAICSHMSVIACILLADAMTVIAFLKTYGLDGEVKVTSHQRPTIDYHPVVT